ncbi:MAG TPA: hypothetical protein VF148_10845, partial [Acidimicrobiia bacterium]
MRSLVPTDTPPGRQLWQTWPMGTFETLQVIDAQGNLVAEDPGLDPELYQTMYRNMVLSRTLDRRML